MSEQPKPILRLTGWKDIAHYLSVSVRTAQTFERDRGLPVHRHAGIKTPVYAVVADLDAWLSKSAAPQPRVDNGRIVGEVVDRRRWLRSAAAGAVVLSGAAFAVGKFGMVYRRPTSYRVEGATLTVSSDDGTVLWRHTFPCLMWESVYRSLPSRCCKFVELDRDDRMQTLFHYLPDNLADCRLTRFNSRGELCWQYAPGREVVDNLGHKFVPTYGVNEFEVLHFRNVLAARIVVSNAHSWSFPNQVAVLDSRTGGLLHEYWHRGHLRHLAVADIDYDGVPEVVLGGVNDAPEYKQATLLVFDARNISGATRNPRGGTYFQGMSSGTEKAVIFFPRTPISRDEEFNHVVKLDVASGRIIVHVAEGISPSAPFMVYELDYKLRVVNAMLSDQLQNTYLELQKRGILPKEPTDVIVAKFMKQVTVIRYDA